MNCRKFSIFGTTTAASLLALPALASGGGDHWSIVTHYMPDAAKDNLRNLIGKTWVGGDTPLISHVIFGVIIFVLTLVLTSVAGKKFKQQGDEAILPEKSFGLFTIFELIAEGLYGLMKDSMGDKQARRFFPLMVAFFYFILISNLLGLVPGMLGATDNFNTTLALASIVFTLTHWYGVKEHGFAHYFAHFLGPIRAWYALPLMVLMLFIEIISHLARPLSLGIRLMGNMFGDHAVLTKFMGFGLLLVPLPVMVLGTIVCIVQAVVFCLLSIVYISMAVEHAEDH